jgi:hypothetical protein
MNFKYLTFLLFFLIVTKTQAQFLQDNTARDATKAGLDYIYNLEFDKADRVLDPVKRKYANHPVVYLLNAVELQWRYLPIDQNPAMLKKYTSELEQCIFSAKKLYKNPAYTKECTFFLLASYGFIALSHNYQKEYLEAASEAKKAYSYFLEGKKLKNEIPEFLFATGLYNFYRVQYPENHGMVKPVVMFFEGGNKKLGLQELEQATRSSVFSRVEASMYLTNINIKYQSNFKKALYYSGDLYAKYPENDILKIKYIECLLLNEQFEQANNLNRSLANSTDRISKISYLVFDGYIEEHYRNNLSKALNSYARSLQLKSDDRYTKEYHSMAYLGMARAFASQNELGKAQAFYKKCNEVAEYKWVSEAAQAELKTLKK